MPENLVPKQQTLCTPHDLYSSLHQAWLQCCQDSTPTRNGLLVLLAHWALETGFGHSCWNWNLGNYKHVLGDGHDYYQVRCNEIIGGQTVWLDPPNPGCSFIAFEDLATGASHYLTALRGTFRAAWPAVCAGDPAQFCHLLKIARYYTADEAVYASGVVRCFRQLDSQIPNVEFNVPDPTMPHQ